MRARCPGTASKRARRNGIRRAPARALTFTDVKGTVIERFFPITCSRKDDGSRRRSDRSSSATSAIACRRAEGGEVLHRSAGFPVSDWRDDTFAFVRCGVDHHTVQFRGRSKAPAQPHRLEVKDWPEIHRACDLPRQEQDPLSGARAATSSAHNVAAYHPQRRQHPRRAVLRDGPGSRTRRWAFRPAAVASGPGRRCRRPGRRTRSATTGAFGSQGTFQAIRENRRPTPTVNNGNES